MIGGLVFVVGLILGSFSNVVIYRVPRDQSIVFPGSRCTRCGHALAPWENVPVVSYLLLRGRCRGCGERISLVYPTVELLTGFVLLSLYAKYDLAGLFWPYSVLSLLIIAGTFIDLEHQLLPDVITLPGLAIGLLFGVTATIAARSGAHPWSSFGLPAYFAQFSAVESLAGAAVGGGVIGLIVLLSRGGMGIGDIKFLAMIGAFVGWRGALGVLFSGAMIGALVGIGLLVTRVKGRKDAIPFGPFLAAGFFVLLFMDSFVLRLFAR